MIDPDYGQPGSATRPATTGPARVCGVRRFRWILTVTTVCAALLACGSPEPDDETAPLDTASESGPEAPGRGPPTGAAAPGSVDSGATGEQTQREAEPDGTALEVAVRRMLNGPGERARAAGTNSWFSDTTAGALRSVTVDDAGRAIVDFADLRRLIPNASTSAGSSMLLSELNSTVFAVPGIQSVEYRIEGSCEAFWEWLQYGGCQVQRRP